MFIHKYFFYFTGVFGRTQEYFTFKAAAGMIWWEETGSFKPFKSFSTYLNSYPGRISMSMTSSSANANAPALLEALK